MEVFVGVEVIFYLGDGVVGGVHDNIFFSNPLISPNSIITHNKYTVKIFQGSTGEAVGLKSFKKVGKTTPKFFDELPKTRYAQAP